MHMGSVCTWVLSGGGGSSAGLRLRWCSGPGCLWPGCFRWQGEGARGCWQEGAVICSITMPLLGAGGNNPAQTGIAWIEMQCWQEAQRLWKTLSFLFKSSHKRIIYAPEYTLNAFFFLFQLFCSHLISETTALTPLAAEQLASKCLDYKGTSAVAITVHSLLLLDPLMIRAIQLSY